MLCIRFERLAYSMGTQCHGTGRRAVHQVASGGAGSAFCICLPAEGNSHSHEEIALFWGPGVPGYDIGVPMI